MRPYLGISNFLILLSCAENQQASDKIRNNHELLEVEDAFCKMASEKGIEQAFLFYADPTATLNRNGLIQGKFGIRKYFSEHDFSHMQLRWTAEFADVSISGDLGYTYGTHILTWPDSNGQMQGDTGVFHTVWKRRDDGS